MNLENVGLLELAASHLGDLLPELVFVGGATVELWITDEAAPEFRPTDDVDVIVEITTRRAYYSFEKQVRSAGFRHDQSSGVVCRYEHPDSGLLLDVMPTEASILGFTNRWQAESFPHAVEIALPSGQTIRAIPPPYLLATKLEAFASRGKGDLYGSRDFGDAVVLIDGREELTGEMADAPAPLRSYVASELDGLSRHANFDAGVEGALPAGPESWERAAQVIRPRIDEIIAMRPSGAAH
jgi:Nucleotidyl transferase AbiEii toxin, Type IV TA system